MVVSYDAIIAIISTCFLGVVGFLAARELSKIDEHIKNLWEHATESREDRFKLSERITRLEEKKGR